KPCPSYTSILDGPDGSAVHTSQRVSFGVVAKSPIGRIHEVARSRGWMGLRLLSWAGTTYNLDYHGEDDRGSHAGAQCFCPAQGQSASHLLRRIARAPEDKGQDARHVDSIWPLWNMFDFTPDARGASWHPKLSYG